MCNDHTIQELLPEYLAKTLDPGNVTRVEQHLASCEDCRMEAGLLRVIADDPVPDPGDAFWAGMPDRIYRELPVGSRRKKRFALPDISNWMFMPRLAWASALLLFIAAVSWFMVRSAQVDIARTTQPAAGTALEENAAEPLNLAELSSTELDAATQWAQNKLAPLEEAITNDTREQPSRDLSEELSELTGPELDQVYEMLKKKEQDTRQKLKKKTGEEKRLG
jgi:hypothetical protein